MRRKQVYNILLEQQVAAPDVLQTWVKKFYTLWRRNQWKRERLPRPFTSMITTWIRAAGSASRF